MVCSATIRNDMRRSAGRRRKLRSIIDIAIIQAGGLASHTIVACGNQACDPHEEGHGLLRANRPIILDIFPRSQKTGYFGDITRTVVRGRASDRLKQAYACVLHGQEIGFRSQIDRHEIRIVGSIDWLSGGRSKYL